MNQTNTIQILATGLDFPEGPAFAPDGSLWAVELKGENLIRWHAGELTRFRVGGTPNGIAIDRDGTIWFCDAGQNAIRRFAPRTSQTETMLDRLEGKPLDKPNDLAFDWLGNLVFTCPGDSRQEPTGYVGVRMRDGTAHLITTGKYFPNGLAFSADSQSLVIAETYRHRLWKGSWNADRGEWTEAGVWAAVEGPTGPGGPDGMAFSEDGRLYVAVFGTGFIHVIDPAGVVVDKLPVPGQNPTNCAFDPSGRLGLVVTEAEQGLIVSGLVARKGIFSFN
jgi:sugar lactone lactonase YvrE